MDLLPFLAISDMNIMAGAAAGNLGPWGNMHEEKAKRTEELLTVGSLGFQTKTKCWFHQTSCCVRGKALISLSSYVECSVIYIQNHSSPMPIGIPSVLASITLRAGKRLREAPDMPRIVWGGFHTLCSSSFATLWEMAFINMYNLP